MFKEVMSALGITCLASARRNNVLLGLLLGFIPLKIILLEYVLLIGIISLWPIRPSALFI